MTEERRVQLVAEVDTTQTRAGFGEIAQQAGAMAQEVTQSGAQAETAVSRIGQQASTTAQQVNQAGTQASRAVNNVGSGASGSARNVENAQRSIIQSIARTTVAMQSGGRQTSAYYEAMARQRGVDPSVLAPYIAQLRAVEQAQAAAAASANNNSAAMGHVGLSAGQINQELRFLPNRFQSIADSITAGQRPMTILIQQGGELVSSFGGIGAASRAVGGYLLGLVSPFLVTVAAIGGVAFAYKTGADEALMFQRAIITSGNAVGTTSSQLVTMAHNVAAISGSLAGSDALAQLVQTGKVSSDNLQKFSILAIDSQRVLGKSIEDTIGEFQKLGQAPLQTLTSISEKYSLITFATLKQVKALQDQGKTTEAANLAQEAYANAIQDQKDKVLATLSSWEKAWMGLKMYAADAANWTVDLFGGRGQSNDDKIKTLLQERGDLEEEQRRARARGLVADVASYQAELDLNKRNIDAIRDQSKAQSDAAASTAKSTKQEQARKDLLTDSDILLTQRQLRQRDLAAAEQRANDNNLTAEEKKQALDIVRKKYYDVYLTDLGLSISKLQQQLAIEELISQRKKEQIQSDLDLGNITQQDAINKTAKADLDDIERKISERRAEIAKLNGKQDSEVQQGQLSDQIGQLQEERRTREQQQKNDLLKLDQKRADQSRDLYQAGVLQATAERDDLNAQVRAQTEYGEEIGLSTSQIADLKAMRLEHLAVLKDETAASLEAIEPGNAVAALYREQAQALRDLGVASVSNANKEQMISQWKEAISQYDQVFQQGFADMLNSGKDGWSSFTKSLVTTFKTSVADELYKMFARPFVVQLVGNFLGVSQTAIAGEIASKQSVLGGASSTDAGSAIGAAQAASSLYRAVSGGYTSLSTSVADAVQLGFDKTGLSGMFDSAASSYDLATGLPANGAAAGMAGTAAAYGAGLLGGHYIGNAIAGGYSVEHGQTVTNVATAVGAALLGPIGGVVGGVVGGLFNRAFGMGSKEVTSQGVSGTLTAASLTGQNYTNWHQDGGWFRSDKNGTDTSALSAAMVSEFTQGLSSIEDASSGFAKSLGVSADWVADYSKTFDIKLTGDATADAQAITTFFAGVGDEIANKLVPNLASFTKTGETASATLERLAGDFKSTDQVAQLLGVSATTLFGSSGIGSATARENLINVAGGLDALNSSASSFNQNFLTDAERLKPVSDALDTALASLSLTTIPTTRAAFKDLVDSLIASGAAATESGAKQLDSLLALSDAFAQVHPDTSEADAQKAADDAQKAAAILQERQGLQDQLDQLTMTSAQLLAKQRDALDDSNKSLFDQVQAATAAAAAIQAHTDAIEAMKSAASALLGDVDSQFAVLQKIVDREKAAVQKSVDTRQAAVDLLSGLSDSIQSTLDSLKGTDQKLADRSSAQAEIRADLAITKAGGSLSSTQVDSLKKALSAVTQDASSQFATYQDYLKDLYQTQSDIGQLGDVTDSQLSVEQAALDAAKAQLDTLDGVLSSAQDQIDVLKGQSTTLLSIDKGIAGLQSAIVAAMANPVSASTSVINGAYQQYLGRAPDAAGLEWWQNAAANGASTSDITSGIAGSTEASLNKLYQSVLGRAPDAAGLQFWMNAYGSTMDSAEMADFLKDAQATDEYKKLHPFAVGTNEVPDTMAALIHKGERIIPAADNRALMAALTNPSSNADVLSAAVDRLTAQSEQQQKTIERLEEVLLAVAGHTSDTATHLDDIVNGRKPIATEVVPATA